MTHLYYNACRIFFLMFVWLTYSMMLSRSYGRKLSGYNTDDTKWKCVVYVRIKDVTVNQSLPWKRKKLVSSISLSSPLYACLPIALWSNNKRKEHGPIVYNQSDLNSISNFHFVNTLLSLKIVLLHWARSECFAHCLFSSQPLTCCRCFVPSCLQRNYWVTLPCDVVFTFFFFGNMIELSWNGSKCMQLIGSSGITPCLNYQLS